MTRRPTWLLVSAARDPSHGGIGAFIARFAAAARDAGWSVHLLTRAEGADLPGVIVHPVRTIDDEPGFAARLPRLRQLEIVRPYRYGLWSLAVAEALLEIDVRPDAIEFVDSRAEGFVALSSRRVRERFRGVPLLVHAHTPMFVEEEIAAADADRFGRTIYHEWERQALRRADGLLVASRALAARLPKHPCSRIVPLPCAAREAGRNPGDVERILVVGAAHPRRGIDVWMESLNVVLAARPVTEAVLVGADTPTGPDGGSMVEFARTRLDPALRGRCHWLGPVPPARVRELMSTASLVVVPSRFESFSLVAAEAIELACPVLVTDAVGIREYVPSLPVAPVGNAHALAQGQLDLLESADATADDAIRCRAELLASCPPRRCLDGRLELAAALRGVSRFAGHAGEPDAIDRMRGTLEAIEAAEIGDGHVGRANPAGTLLGPGAGGGGDRATAHGAPVS